MIACLVETGDIMDEEVEEFKESSKRYEYGDFEGVKLFLAANTNSNNIFQ